MLFHDNVRWYFKDHMIYELMRQHDPRVALDIWDWKMWIADYNKNLNNRNWNWVAEIQNGKKKKKIKG